MMLNYRQEVLQALRIAAKGQERLNILNLKHNRDFIKNSGANVTLVSGKISSGKTTKQQMQNLNLGLIARLNAKTGMPDGIGAMGGLAERTSFEEFSRLHQDERRRLVGLRDDIVLQNDSPVLINDINLIRINNVLRETREELENLGITDVKLPAEKIKLINMPDIRDDNYAVNIWNGGQKKIKYQPVKDLEIGYSTKRTLHIRAVILENPGTRIGRTGNTNHLGRLKKNNGKKPLLKNGKDYMKNGMVSKTL